MYPKQNLLIKIEMTKNETKKIVIYNIFINKIN